ncbi:MAG: D-glycerate dehydrogenase [Anaerolinea sp.]|nr:D-glycerate dehydrogenase [Anaerolinea sp.]
MAIHKFKVLLTHPIPEQWLSTLNNDVKLIIGPDEMMGLAPELYKYLPEVDGLISFLCDRINAEIIHHAPNIRVICNFAAGIDNIDLLACTAQKIPVGITPGVLTDATADLTMGLVLAVNRQLVQAAANARSGKWKMWYASRWLGMGLSGAILGVFGMGKIGCAVAKRAHAFGMNVIYTSRTPKPEYEITLNARQVAFQELLKTSDILSLHAPLTPETNKIMDANAFKLMKPTAILINTARGAEVDTEALFSALSNRQIAAAGLDVTDPEPLPASHPLYELPNCLILPHLGSATVGARKAMAAMTCENLLAGLRGEKLPYCANTEVYV